MEIKYRNDLGQLMESMYLAGGDVAEIGVAEAWFTKEIIKWNIGTLYLVDAWTHLEQFGDGAMSQEWHDTNYGRALERTKDFQYKVILRGLTQDMIPKIPDNSLSLTYVDASHVYIDVLNDLRAIWPKLMQGAILSGHDVLNPRYGVMKALVDFIKEIGYSMDDVHYTEEDGDKSMVSFWLVKK